MAFLQVLVIMLASSETRTTSSSELVGGLLFALGC
jgi:hypothetical protein